MTRPGNNMEERFLDRVSPEPTTGCWLWSGAISGCGYGTFDIDGVSARAHRVSYELFRGPIPARLCVCHKCDTPCCVNPEHLFLGTQRENILDAIRKGRVIPVIRADSNGHTEPKECGVERIKPTHCKNSHALVGDNLKATGHGDGARCRTCHNDRSRESMRRLLALRKKETA